MALSLRSLGGVPREQKMLKGYYPDSYISPSLLLESFERPASGLPPDPNATRDEHHSRLNIFFKDFFCWNTCLKVNIGTNVQIPRSRDLSPENEIDLPEIISHYLPHVRFISRDLPPASEIYLPGFISRKWHLSPGIYLPLSPASEIYLPGFISRKWDLSPGTYLPQVRFVFRDLFPIISHKWDWSHRIYLPRVRFISRNLSPTS